MVEPNQHTDISYLHSKVIQVVFINERNLTKAYTKKKDNGERERKKRKKNNERKKERNTRQNRVTENDENFEKYIFLSATC